MLLAKGTMLNFCFMKDGFNVLFDTAAALSSYPPKQNRRRVPFFGGFAKQNMSPPTYISPEQLLEKLRSENPPKVIDVREDDRKGGHIRNSLHIPAPVFRAVPSRLVPVVKDADLVVVHCMYSQVRGPSCAALLAASLDSAMAQGEIETSPNVCVLEGGFVAMIEIREGNEDLFQEFDARYHF